MKECCRCLDGSCQRHVRRGAQSDGPSMMIGKGTRRRTRTYLYGLRWHVRGGARLVDSVGRGHNGVYAEAYSWCGPGRRGWRACRGVRLMRRGKAWSART